MFLGVNISYTIRSEIGFQRETLSLEKTNKRVAAPVTSEKLADFAYLDAFSQKLSDNF